MAAALSKPGVVVRQPRGLFVGLTVLDVVSRVGVFPQPNQKVTATSQTIAAGGPAANAAVTFAALGGHATLLTALGSSPQADIARQDLAVHGVHVIDVAPEGFELSVSSVTVTDGSGDRSVVSTDGGTVTVRAEGRESWLECLEVADVVLFDGHHPEIARSVLSEGEKQGNPAVTVVDAGRWKPQFEWILPQVQHIVASADFEDPYGWVPTESDQQSLRVDATVVRTQGSGPVLWWSGSSSGHVAAQEVSVRDTLGAGDVFHGAYVYREAQLRLRDDAQRRTDVAVTESDNDASRCSEIIEFASAIAALKISHVGPRTWISALPSPVGR